MFVAGFTAILYLSYRGAYGGTSVRLIVLSMLHCISPYRKFPLGFFFQVSRLIRYI